MQWDERLKKAHSEGGPFAVSGEAHRVIREICTYDGRVDMRHLSPILEKDKQGDLFTSLMLCYRLDLFVSYWDINARDRNDTPTRQLRELEQILSVYKGFHNKTPPKYQFMLETISDQLDQTIADFNAVRKQQESRSGVMWSLVERASEVAVHLRAEHMDGPNIREFNSWILLSKLSK